MNRLVLTDAPGEPMVVTAYSDDGRLVRVELVPLRVLRLARDLIEAAERRLREVRA